MKTNFFALAAIFAFVCASGNCKKHKPDAEQLPPLTNTGERTFGCLINSKIFLPRQEGLNTSQQCYYQRVYNSERGYVFVVSANHDRGCESSGIIIRLDSIELVQDESYILTIESIGSNVGIYVISPDCNTYIEATTNNEQTGELTITYLDEVNRIVAGTFWMNLKDASGKTYKITDGRFDQQYNQ